MNRAIARVLSTSLLLLAPIVMAQQLERFGDYEVHYNVLTTDQIPAPVAQGYGIKRSSSRGLLNVTVLDTTAGESPGEPIHAEVTVNAVNLTGQLRDIPMRVIEEPGEAVYYIGDFPVHHLETYTFTVTVEVEGAEEPFELEFRQQFFTE